MKLVYLLLVATVAMSGCSASVRPVYSDTADVTDAMRARADSLGLSLSESGRLILAKALAQGESFCALTEQAMEADVALTARGGETVPVVHVRCVPTQSATDEGLNPSIKSL